MSILALVQYDRRVLGYHGCDAATADRLLRGEPFRPSDNDYDWLARGVYFWEFGQDRAWRFARSKFEQPAVVGALIQLGNCFDLTDTLHTDELAAAYGVFRNGLIERGVDLPVNIGGPDRKARRLDCAVIEFALRVAPRSYDCVRCAFPEGDLVYPGAGMSRESHIQLSIRNPTCILGVFRPTLLV